MDEIRRTQLRTIAPVLEAVVQTIGAVRRTEAEVKGATLHGDKKQYFFSLLVAEALLAQAMHICREVSIDREQVDLSRLEDLVGSTFFLDETRSRRMLGGFASGLISKESVDFLAPSYRFGADERGEPLGLDILGDLLEDLSDPQQRAIVLFAATSFFSERERRRPTSSLRPSWLSLTALHDIQRAYAFWPTINLDGTQVQCEVRLKNVTDTGFRIHFIRRSAGTLPDGGQLAHVVGAHFGLPPGALVPIMSHPLTSDEQEEFKGSHIAEYGVFGTSHLVEFYRAVSVAPSPVEMAGEWIPGQVGPTGREIPPPPPPPTPMWKVTT